MSSLERANGAIEGGHMEDPQQACSFAPLLHIFNSFPWLGGSQSPAPPARKRKRPGSLVMLPLFYYQSYEYSQAHVTDLHVRIARQPVHVVIVVDLTRATGAYARLDLMRTVLKALIARLGVRDSVSLTLWDGGVTSLPATRLTSEGKGQMYTMLDNLRPPQESDTSSHPSAALTVGIERVTAIDRADLTSSASLHLMILSDGGAFAPTSRSPEPSSPRQQTRQPAGSIDHSAPTSPLGRSKSPVPVSGNDGALMPADQAPLLEASVVRQVLSSLESCVVVPLPLSVLEVGGHAHRETWQEALRGRGSYHHVGGSGDVSACVEARSEALACVCTQELVLTLEANGGCEITELQCPEAQVFTYRERAKYSLRLDALLEDDYRDVLVSLSLPTERWPDLATHVATLTLEYRDGVHSSGKGPGQPQEWEVVSQRVEVTVPRPDLRQPEESGCQWAQQAYRAFDQRAEAGGSASASSQQADGTEVTHGPLNASVAYQVLLMSTRRVLTEAYDLQDRDRMDEAVALLQTQLERLEWFDNNVHSGDLRMYPQIRDVNKALMEIGQEMEDDGRQQLGQTGRLSMDGSGSRAPLSSSTSFRIARSGAPQPQAAFLNPRMQATGGRKSPLQEPVRATIPALSSTMRGHDIISAKTTGREASKESLTVTMGGPLQVLRRMASSPHGGGAVVGDSAKVDLAATLPLTKTPSTTFKTIFGGRMSSPPGSTSPSPPPVGPSRGGRGSPRNHK